MRFLFDVISTDNSMGTIVKADSVVCGRVHKMLGTFTAMDLNRINENGLEVLVQSSRYPYRLTNRSESFRVEAPLREHGNPSVAFGSGLAVCGAMEPGFGMPAC